MGVWPIDALVALHRTASLPLYVRCVSLKLGLIISHQNNLRAIMILISPKLNGMDQNKFRSQFFSKYWTEFSCMVSVKKKKKHDFEPICRHSAVLHYTVHTRFLMSIYVGTICVPSNGAKVLNFSSGALQGHLQLSDCNDVAKTSSPPQKKSKSLQNDKLPGFFVQTGTCTGRFCSIALRS